MTLRLEEFAELERQESWTISKNSEEHHQWKTQQDQGTSDSRAPSFAAPEAHGKLISPSAPVCRVLFDQYSIIVSESKEILVRKARTKQRLAN